MLKRLAMSALVTVLLVLAGCQTPQAPLRLESAWVESGGEKTDLLLDRDHDVLVNTQGRLCLTFNRQPKLTEVKGLLGTELTYHLNERELQITLSPGIDRLTVPPALTGSAGVSLAFHYLSPTGKNLRVLGVELFMSGRRLEPTREGPYTVLGDDGSLRLKFNNRLNRELAPIITHGIVTGAFGESLWFALKPENKQIIIPDRLCAIDGNTLAESLTYEFVYAKAVESKDTFSLRPRSHPWLELGRGSLGYGTPLLFTVHWRFSQAEVERYIHESLQGADYDLYWLSQEQLVLTIRSTPHSQICLKFVGIIDEYGYRHLDEHLLTFYHKMHSPQIFKVFSLKDGTVSNTPLPFAVDGGLRMSPDFSEAVLYHNGYETVLDGDNSYFRREVILDLGTSLVRGGEHTNVGMYEYAGTSPWEAWDVLDHLMPKIDYPLAAGLSPTGSKVALIRQIGAAKVLEVYSRAGKLLQAIPVKLHASYLEPAQLITWSYEESTVYYLAAYPDGESAIVSMDLSRGEEKYVVRESYVNMVRSSLPSGYTIIQRSDASFHLLAPDGTTKRLADGNQQVHVGAVMDENRVFMNMGGDCYLYELRTGTQTFISQGKAFAYDASTQRVFMIDIVR